MSIIELRPGIRPFTKHRIGDMIKQQGRKRVHRYTLVNVREYTRRDGAASLVLEWSAICATCRCAFMATSGRFGGALARNCPQHRRRRVIRTDGAE
jgi:hypothetical protein